MKSIVIILTFLAFFINLFAGEIEYSDSRVMLFPVNGEKCLLAWQNYPDSIESYSACFFTQDKHRQGEPFPVYSNQRVIFDGREHFIATRHYEYSGGDYLLDSYADWAVFYRNPSEYGKAFMINGGEWPDCGTGYLGVEDILLGMKNGYLYYRKDDGRVILKSYDVIGQDSLMWDENRQAGDIAIAALNDSNWICSWLKARESSWDDSVVFGAYLTRFQNSQLVEDSILLRAYPQYRDRWYNESAQIGLSVLNDSLYQFFIWETDSLRLISYVLNAEGRAIDSVTVDIPLLNGASGFAHTPVMNISNFAGGTRSVYLSFYGIGESRNFPCNYLFYFDYNGQYTGQMDTLSDTRFNQNSFHFKTDSREFFNAGRRGDSALVVVFEGFTPTEGFGIGQITALERNPLSTVHYFNLEQNYPNPFNPETVIRYQLPALSEVKGSVFSQVNLSIYNVLGQRIATLVNKKQPAGRYTVTWNAGNYPAGVYFYHLLVSGVGSSQREVWSKTRKMLLIK